MQFDYANDGSGPTSDFPTDPVFPYDWMFWSIGAAVLVLVLGVAVFVFYRMGVRKVESEALEAVAKRTEAVRKVLSEASRAPEDVQEARLRAGVDEINKQFGQTLALSAAFSKSIGALNTAMEGTREEAATAGALFPNGAHVSGNTIINIAVNQGEIVPYPHAAAAAAASAGDDKVPMSEDEKSESIWKAVQRIFDYWKHRNAVIASLRAVQIQLQAQPAWVPPRLDDRAMTAVFRRED